MLSYTWTSAEHSLKPVRKSIVAGEKSLTEKNAAKNPFLYELYRQRSSHVQNGRFGIDIQNDEDSRMDWKYWMPLDIFPSILNE